MLNISIFVLHIETRWCSVLLFDAKISCGWHAVSDFHFARLICKYWVFDMCQWRSVYLLRYMKDTS